MKCANYLRQTVIPQTLSATITMHTSNGFWSVIPDATFATLDLRRTISQHLIGSTTRLLTLPLTLSGVDVSAVRTEAADVARLMIQIKRYCIKNNLPMTISSKPVYHIL